MVDLWLTSIRLLSTIAVESGWKVEDNREE